MVLAEIFRLPSRAPVRLETFKDLDEVDRWIARLEKTSVSVMYTDSYLIGICITDIATGGHLGEMTLDDWIRDRKA